MDIAIYAVDQEGETRHYVSPVAHEIGFTHGLVEEAVAGALRGEPDPDGAIAPEAFVPSPHFVDFLQGFVARHGPGLPSIVDGAREQGDGHVLVIDGRTPTPDTEVPGHDILGAFRAENGVLVPDGYQANPHHRLWTDYGFVQLELPLEEALVGELERRCAERPPS